MVKDRKRYCHSSQGRARFFRQPRTQPFRAGRRSLESRAPALGVALSALAARGPRAPSLSRSRTGSRDRADTDGEAVQPAPSRPGESNALTPEDQSLLDEIQRATFLYFWEQADPLTGLVRDRFNVRAAADTAVCGKHRRHRLRADRALYRRGSASSCAPVEARDRVIATLRFLHSDMPTHRGFYYHWANVHSGRGSGTRRSRRSTRRFCSAACSRAASTSVTGRSRAWRRRSSTVSSGRGSRRTRRCCRTAGDPRSGSCSIAGTCTAS